MNFHRPLAESRKERFIRMTETPVERLIVSLAIPTMISMMVTALYNSADTYFVGSISTEATASVGVVFSVMAFIQALGFFCGHGSGNYLSRQIGAGNDREASEAAATGFALAAILGVFLAVSGLVFIRPLAVFLGATPLMMEDTVRYMRIILCGAPVMIPEIVLNNQLRFQGASVYAMFGLVSGAILNIGLDPLMIFVFRMGVTGAALATVLSQTVALLILWLGTRQGGNVRIEPRNIRLNAHYLLQIVNGGAPSLFRQGLSSVSTILLNNLAGALGSEAAIAGMSIVTRVMMMLNSAVIGFGQGFQPVASFNYGAKKYERVRNGYIFCVKCATVFLAFVSVLCLLFAPQIVSFFRDDPAVIGIGKNALRCQAAVFWVFGFTVMSNMMMQSIGKGVRASLMASFRSGLFFIPALLILSRLLGLTGVEMAQAVADLCAFLCSIPIVLSEWGELTSGGEDG